MLHLILYLLLFMLYNLIAVTFRLGSDTTGGGGGVVQHKGDGGCG